MCKLNNFIVLTINLLKHTLLFYNHAQKKPKVVLLPFSGKLFLPETDEGKRQKRDVPGSFPDHDIVG